MITLQHSLLTLLALMKKYPNLHMRIIKTTFFDKIPWVLFPDGIRCMIGERQLGHFERSCTTNDVSWMKYPTAAELSEITSENIREKVKYHLADGIKPCVIGERTEIGVFELRNWAHPEKEYLKIHLIQDCILDEIIRGLVDCSNRFSDKFLIKETKEWIDGAELRNQIAIFERLGVLKLAEAVYKYSKILITQKWLDENVKDALDITFDTLEPLAEKTYSFMQLSNYGDLATRIINKQWEFTEEDKNSCKLTSDLEGVLDVLYSNALEETMKLL